MLTNIVLIFIPIVMLIYFIYKKNRKKTALFLFENKAGNPSHFAHALLGYFIPFCYFYLKNKDLLEGKILHLIPEQGDWDANPAILQNFLSESFPEIKFVFSKPYISGLTLTVPGGIPGRAGFALEKHPQMLKVVRAFLVSRFGITGCNKSLVFIRRGEDRRLGKDSNGAARRRITNHQDVLSCLVNNFDIPVVDIELESLPLKQQIACFYNASIVVGQHGSGLWNAIWCRECKAIIELGAMKSDFPIACQIVGACHYTFMEVPNSKLMENLYAGYLSIDILKFENFLINKVRV